MSTDRSAVVSAINSSRNLGDAARKLGASRRTLQNRMRAYGIPRGQAGRPKEWLPYKKGWLPNPRGASDLLLVCGVGAGIFFAVRYLRSKQNEHVAGDTSPLAGLIAERK